MTGHQSFFNLRRRLSPKRLAANAEAARTMLGDIERRELALRRLRQAHRQSREDLALALKVKEPAIAQLEQRADLYVDNLRRYVEALGGTLEIIARFPDGEVTITSFRDAGPEADRPGGEPAAE